MTEQSHDPLDVLASPVEPALPDPTFANRLRTRLVRAFELPEGVAVSDLTLHAPANDPAASGTTAVPRPGALPYLCVRGATDAIDWYADAFDAHLSGDPYLMPDGRVGHAELDVGGGVIYLADEFADLGLVAPRPGETSVSLMLPVADTDAVLERARSRGAQVEREPYDEYGGRNASLIDPFGHRWMLRQPLSEADVAEDLVPIRHGDIGYASWWTLDAERAGRFYGRVLGWTVVAGEGHAQVSTLSRPQGIHGGHDRSTLYLCFAVDDIDEAVAAVRAGGGSAEEPVDNPYGATAGCVDNQGTEFAVYRPRAGDTRPALTGEGHGDLAYITCSVADSAAMREFYGAVLGWSFEAGRVDDGWQPVDVAPMVGVAGGGDGTTTPMWLVDDVRAAVEEVRAAGGTVVSEPERQPYGVSAECVDDQGGTFYLGQL